MQSQLLGCFSFPTFHTGVLAEQPQMYFLTFTVRKLFLSSLFCTSVLVWWICNISCNIVSKRNFSTMHVVCIWQNKTVFWIKWDTVYRPVGWRFLLQMSGFCAVANQCHISLYLIEVSRTVLTSDEVWSSFLLWTLACPLCSAAFTTVPCYLETTTRGLNDQCLALCSEYFTIQSKLFTKQLFYKMYMNVDL